MVHNYEFNMCDDSLFSPKIQQSLDYLGCAISAKNELGTHYAAYKIRTKLNQEERCWLGLTTMLTLDYEEFKTTTDLWWDNHWKGVYKHDL